MADKDEVDPAEESTDPVDATVDPRAQTAPDAEDLTEGDALDDEDERETDPVPSDDPDVEGGEPVDEFDEIVRGSGVGESEEDEAALEPAGVVATGAAGARGATARTAKPAPKGTATARRDRPVKAERTTPAKFVRESVGELRKVVYPTGNQLINYFVVVLVFVLVIIAYVGLLDLGLGWALFKVFS